MKKILVNVLVCVIAMALSLIAVEFAVRKILPWYDPARQICFMTNADGFALGKPNDVIRQRTPKGDFDLFSRFNQHGLRDTKDLAGSRFGDIFVLGDSFSFGWGVADGRRYSDLLEQSMRRPVYNISIPEDIVGYQKLLAYARGHGAKISSLVIGVCMENDLADYKSRGRVAQVPVAGGAGRLDWRSFFKSRSALYLACSYELQKIPFLKRILEKSGLARDIEGLAHQNVLDENILLSSRDEVLKVVGAVDAAVVLIIPARMLWQAKNSDNERQVHDRFVSLLKAAGVKVVDMRPYFEKGGSPLEYYFKTDPHWNEKGHALAAKVLSEYFSK